MCRHLGVASLLMFVLCSTSLLAEEKPVEAAELVRRIHAEQFRFRDLDSLMIRIETLVTCSPELIEKRLRELQKQFPNSTLSEEKFIDLRPAVRGEVEFAYDRQRFSFRQYQENYHLDRRFFDGEKQVYHSKYVNHRQEQFGYVLADDLKGSFVHFHWTIAPWLLLGGQGFWWCPSEYRGRYQVFPDDYEIVSEQDCEGHACYVVANVWTGIFNYPYIIFLWIGKEDCRLYGIGYSIGESSYRSQAKTLSEGKYSWDWYSALSPSEQELFNRKVFDASNVTSSAKPDILFSEYREISPGISIPHLIRFMGYPKAGDVPPKIEPYYERRYTITEVNTHQSLSDDKFTIKFEEGVDVSDQRMSPTLHYKYKENMTATDRDEILAAYRKQIEEWNSLKQESKRAVGKKAVEFRKASVWLNHAPMSFKHDLKGKVVVLNFWDVNCGPCKNDMKFLADWRKSNPKSELQVIGIHCSMKPKEEIQKVVDAYDVKYPICSDFYAPWEKLALQGYLAKSYFAPYMPFTVVIDSEGRVANAGSLLEVMPEAYRLQQELEQKLAKVEGPKEKS